MKCLVTGGGGFLGSQITRQLLEHGYKVRVLLRRKEIPTNLNKLEIEIFIGDVRDQDTVAEIVKGTDFVFHTASLYETTPFYVHYPKHLYDINVNGTKNVCQASLNAGVKKLVYTGSTAAVGLNPDKSPADESVKLNLLSKRSHYEKSKALGEETALSFNRNGMEVVSVNPSFLIGPGDIRPTPTGEFIVKFLNRTYPCYFDAVLCVSDLTSTAQAHIDALERGVGGQRYITAMEQHLTIKEIFDRLEKISGIKAPKLKLPMLALKSVSMINEAFLGLFNLRSRYKPLIAYELVRYLSLGCRYNSAKARKEIGFQSRSLDETIKEAIHWFKTNGYVKGKF